MRFEAVINRLMFEAHFGGRITIEGSGHQRRGFIHVHSDARALAGLVLDPVEPGIHNLVEHDLSVLEVSKHIQELYPDLETLYVQQEIESRNLEILPDAEIDSSGLIEASDFAAQLRDFKAHFAFDPP